MIRGTIIKNKNSFSSEWVNGCERIVALAECSRGNGEVGEMWVETKSFPKTASLDEVLNWAIEMNATGRIMIRPDLATYKANK